MDIKLDLIDKKILHELDKDARASYSDIAKKTRVAKETVKYRINNLLKHKILLGFYTVLDYSKLGLNVYRFYLHLQNVTPEKEQEISSFISDLREVLIVYKTTGTNHLSFGIYAPNQWKCGEILLKIKSNFLLYISNIHFSVFTSYV